LIYIDVYRIIEEGGLMKIILVRHGESESNKQKVWQGTIDSNLSEKGLSDAIKIGARFCKENISAIYSSKLKRAMSTAFEIAKYHSINITEEEGFNECGIELWDNCTFEEIQNLYANEYYE
jgi:Fructose-2,6-bisphosphatase